MGTALAIALVSVASVSAADPLASAHNVVKNNVNERTNRTSNTSELIEPLHIFTQAYRLLHFHEGEIPHGR
jgi:hypothetical protein